VWELTNVDTAAQLSPHLADQAPAVRRYRDRGNRSLCTGDVLVVTAHQQRSAWVAERVGFRELDEPPAY
jgi:hypothetical protein